MILALVLAAFAHADYFETQRRFQAEAAARAQATAEAQKAAETAANNQRMMDFAATVGAKFGGGYNFASQPCQSLYCYEYGRDWIGSVTFDTRRGYQCYSRVVPSGTEYHCVNPNNENDRVDVDNRSKPSWAREPEKKPRRHR